MSVQLKILVPIDGSAYSLRAIEFIAARPQLVGIDPRVELINVQAELPSGAVRVTGARAMRTYYDEQTERALRPALKRLAKAGIKATFKAMMGNPAEQIAATATKDKIDLIMMGSHGHSAFKGLLVGSVTHAVLARCTKPIMLLRSKQVPTGASLKLGVAVDGSKFGLAAVKYLLKHRELLGSEPKVLLIHVVSDFAGMMMPDMSGMVVPAISNQQLVSMQKQTFEAAIAPARKLFAKAGLAAEEVALAGIAGDEIAALAKKRKLDLLVMGSHGHSAFRAAMMGSVTTRVAAKTKLPLLLIRAH